MSIIKRESNGSKIGVYCIDLSPNEEEGKNFERGNSNPQGNQGEHYDSRIIFTFVGHNRYKDGCFSSAGAKLRGINFDRGKAGNNNLFLERNCNIYFKIIREFKYNRPYLLYGG